MPKIVGLRGCIGNQEGRGSVELGRADCGRLPFVNVEVVVRQAIDNGEILINCEVQPNKGRASGVEMWAGGKSVPLEADEP